MCIKLTFIQNKLSIKHAHIITSNLPKKILLLIISKCKAVEFEELLKLLYFYKIK